MNFTKTFLLFFVFFLNLNALLPSDAPSLGNPPDTHTIVTVSTIEELNSAIYDAVDHTTIWVKSGSYDLTTLAQKQLSTPNNYKLTDLVIRGETGNPEDVIIEGVSATDDSATFGIQIWDTENVVIADMTFRRVFYHCVSIHPENGATQVKLYHLIFEDAGEQLVKVNKGTDNALEGLIIQYCTFKYTDGVPNKSNGECYSNGISAHYVTGMILENCLFRNNYCQDSGQLCGGNILVWSKSKDTQIIGNTFYNYAQGIVLGLNEDEDDHTGGIVKNNIFYRAKTTNYQQDVSIYVISKNAKVYHNTIITEDSYYAPLEVRYEFATGVVFKNNLLDSGFINYRNNAPDANQNSGNIFDVETDQFYDYDSQNFKAKNENATFVDKVDTIQECNVDFSLITRPQGEKSDIGAFEYKLDDSNDSDNDSDDDDIVSSAQNIGAHLFGKILILFSFLLILFKF
ncbi:hypothetical protein M0812_15979 [Anaeramoeba flamelloides]|uniref:Right handed beta helix domain-containing protein n=1 Tax=Anaeramoeba flamelloides TaxID=1746091 RepID=A0AAV7ZD56_9EUKA|nr:hypothetical protein M0812_15979 [Anaeramoeba flamelloides]